MSNDKSISAHTAAKRLLVHPCTVRRMFHKGLLHGYLTGTTKTRIRIFESSILEHMTYQKDEQ
jgi:hypothetical protein